MDVNGNISLAAQVMRFFTSATAFEYKGIAFHLTLVELSSQTVAILKSSIPAVVLCVIGFFVLRFRNAPELISKWGLYSLVFALVPCFSTITEVPHLVLLAPAAIFVAHVIFVERVKGRALTMAVCGVLCADDAYVKDFRGRIYGQGLRIDGRRDARRGLAGCGSCPMPLSPQEEQQNYRSNVTVFAR